MNKKVECVFRCCLMVGGVSIEFTSLRFAPHKKIYLYKNRMKIAEFDSAVYSMKCINTDTRIYRDYTLVKK